MWQKLSYFQVHGARMTNMSPDGCSALVATWLQVALFFERPPLRVSSFRLWRINFNFKVLASPQLPPLRGDLLRQSCRLNSGVVLGGGSSNGNSIREEPPPRERHFISLCFNVQTHFSSAKPFPKLVALRARRF